MQISWQNNASFKDLASHEVHLWCFDVARYQSERHILAMALSEDERLRATRFQQESLSSKFIITRGLLRQTLSPYLKQKPNKVIFNYSPNGKPGVKGVFFNVSHSENLVIFAISGDAPLGVDIQVKRPIVGLESLCQRFLSAEECQFLSMQPAIEQINCFYDLWTQKEAFTKAIDGRLINVLSDLKKGSKLNMGSFYIQQLDIKEKYAAALAIKTKPVVLKGFSSLSDAE